MIRTPSLMLAASVLSVFALSGCGDGTVRTGAAATVGDVRITDDTLNAYVTRGLKDPSAQQSVGADRPKFERTVLQRLIGHQIVLAAAKEEHVTAAGADVDSYEADLDARIQQAGQGTLETAVLAAGISKQDLRETLTDQVLREGIADRLTEKVDVPDSVLQQGYQQNIANYDKVDSAHILVASKPLADSILKQVKADPSQFAALAAKYSTDTGSKGNGGDLGYQGRGALVKEFENAIFTNKPGSIVEVKTQFGYHVIKVIDRKITSFEQAKTALRRELLSQQRAEALSQFLSKVAKKLGVHVNPRFGVWKAETQEVVAPTLCPGTAFASPSPRAGDAAAPQPSTSPTADPCASASPTAQP